MIAEQGLPAVIVNPSTTIQLAARAEEPLRPKEEAVNGKWTEPPLKRAE
jgi:hypothetical protein